jgi:hypothetical protein
MVGVAGFEPAASPLQAGVSNHADLHTVGRGDMYHIHEGDAMVNGQTQRRVS